MHKPSQNWTPCGLNSLLFAVIKIVLVTRLIVPQFLAMAKRNEAKPSQVK